MEKARVGVIGLAVMGANLARNISRNFSTIVYNRTTEKMEAFIKEFGNENLHGEADFKKFIEKLETPRKIILMIKSGDAIDQIIDQLTPLLEKGDIVMDGGNSHYKDTEKRQQKLAAKGINFLGMGISGGEEGALHGPSIMPGGDEEAYKKVADILEKSAAEVDIDGKCVTYIGHGSSGHFVKMVHNGIEYGIMQLIAETYDMLKSLGNYSNKELAQTFNEWQKAENLQSFLIEITAKIFQKKDPETGKDLIDLIKDSAQQKGTGKWTSVAAFDYGIAVPTINAAVDARIISGTVPSRATGKNFPQSLNDIEIPNKKSIKEFAKNSLILSTILVYFQGFDLMQIANKEYNWGLNFSEIARIWRGGCIIRSDLLAAFQKLFSPDPQESHILQNFEGSAQTDWRKFISLGINHGIPLPAFSSGLAYYDALRKEQLPQNLIQAQRDFFGAHTYERVDKNGHFHTDWQ